MPTCDEIAAFYDNHSTRMLRDFVHGNARVSAATNLILSTLRGGERTLLDIGCGIGTMTHIVSNRTETIQALGVDISPKSIEIANRLFATDRVQFLVSHLSEPPPGGPFDVVTLVDVYEHIQRQNWPEFNNVLAHCLSDNGTLVLTTPSVLHQEYLVRNEPEGLQVVDETVSFDDILQLSKDINASVSLYQHVPVWRTNQYVHVVLQRKPRYEVVQADERRLNIGYHLRRQVRKLFGVESGIEDVRHRRSLVYSRLGVLLN